MTVDRRLIPGILLILLGIAVVAAITVATGSGC
jgi:hypothetical protein